MGIFSDVLLTVDFDRTMTAPDSTIPQRNLEAVRYFMENGGAFTLNTGRSVPMSTRVLNVIPVNVPFLLYNGSAAYDREKKELLQCRIIELEPEALINDLQSRFPELTVELQGTYAHHIFRKDPGWEAYCENNGCPWEYADAANIPLPFLKLALYGEFRENTVASMYQASREELELFDAATGYIEEKYGDKVDCFRACARILDIHAKGCSKLNSAKQLQNTLGRKILVCVGDAENDETMLDGADYAYCPADGVVADRYENVCCCAEGAVADVIYRKIPEILALREKTNGTV